MIIINSGRVVAAGTSAQLREEFLPSSRFSLVVEGNDTAVATCLASHGIDAAILKRTPMAENRSELNLRIENAGDLGPKLIQSLSNQREFILHSLAPREPNLEEIFLAATKRSWEETIETKPKISAQSLSNH